jgi:hypothetical protein
LSLQHIKRDIEELKKSTNIGHLQELLKRNPDDLTDSECCQLLMEVSIRQIPPNIIKVIGERAYKTNGKSLSGVSTERLREIRDEAHEMTKECSENEPAAVKKRA